MPDLAMGERIKDRVREFFRKGHKSNNKLYAVQTDGSIDEAMFAAVQVKAKIKIMARSQHAESVVRFRAASYYGLAQELIKVPIATRGGNCGEQAGLAAWYMLKSEFIRRDLIHIATVTHPGDHAFCLVSDLAIPAGSRRYASLYDFSRSGAAASYLAVDPWLNTSCAADDYAVLGWMKLGKWQADGKRVAWGAGSQGPGWYAPGGEYRDIFALEAPLNITPF